MFQIECLVNVAYTLNACVLYCLFFFFFLLLQSPFVLYTGLFINNDINWRPRPADY